MHDETNSVVSHSNDSRFRFLRSLRSPQGRAQTNLFLAEGIRHVARAVEERAPIESIFYSRSAMSNTFGQKLIRRLTKAGTPCLRLSPDLYRGLTLAVDPQGIGAVVRQRWPRLDSLRPSPDSLWLALESIESPGNLGTILRTAEAAGVAGVIVIGESADPHDPAAVRASMGALFAQTLVRATIREFAAWSATHGVTAVGSSPTGLLSHRALPCRFPAALLIGCEKTGLSSALIEACHYAVRIPMHGRGDSINVAVAAGVLLFELAHQRVLSETGGRSGHGSFRGLRP